MTLGEIVSHYILEHRDDARKEMRFFEIQPSPSEAMRESNASTGLCFKTLPQS
jgi:hypothetical protein